MQILKRAGSKKHVAAIFDLLERNKHFWQLVELMQAAGFEYFSSGSSRRVFIRDGWVYKIAARQMDYCNEIEGRQAYRCSFMPLHGWRIPQTTMYRRGGVTVIAMEYIDGTQPQYGLEEYETAAAHWAMTDIDAHNVLIDSNGWYVPIDMGAHSWHDESDVDGFFKSLEQAA